jgi:hypothetical protein
MIVAVVVTARASPRPAFFSSRERNRGRRLLRRYATASRAFYEGQMGMKYLTFLDFPDLAFSLYFYAYTDVVSACVRDKSTPTPLSC